MERKEEGVLLTDQEFAHFENFQESQALSQFLKIPFWFDGIVISPSI